MTDTPPPFEPTEPTASETGWRVRILDLSGGAEEGIVEDIGGFLDLAHANAFARAYVRDSIERCRVAGAAPREVLQAWMSFGEDAEILDAGDDGWRSANELDDFTAHAATPMERDWRTIDPRRMVEDDEDETPE
ncbi:conserved hypothetical protein [Gluconacetobacter diazotrophicus PA1 5]|uniref:Uncharacterized protein n=1 Tax=Gluconacetobacter diazotrophicus (strain ATCC 49037 / DSM 5601 / CCUG 37298 / CIP 103539 / LMG 7603 / PAl5) TaxID=272568 RepID=A9HLE3_GLUDA|nr:hypothetical protein [Gluconacetobacter diazotrophicus]ACI50226.1 conserved hypothetical protein [Gluconacetobacter diazotrophicus PA1 5]TWB08018.1 hypothetical protein FBZ86_10836 [Gluconacetobacter diazotrophicus]CAP56155.1 conserved hypothetical protein [Gluconacetobacter diazotrophicus PA1 5]